MALKVNEVPTVCQADQVVWAPRVKKALAVCQVSTATQVRTVLQV